MEVERMVAVSHTQRIMSEEFKLQRGREREAEIPTVFQLEGFW